MERTTILLPRDLKARSQIRAKGQGISLGQFVRESVKAMLARTAEEPSASDPLFADDAVYLGQTPSDLALRHDRYLYGEIE